MGAEGTKLGSRVTETFPRRVLAGRKAVGDYRTPGRFARSWRDPNLQGSEQALGLREAVSDVHALHGPPLACPDDVVLGADDEEPAGPGIEAPRDFHQVGADHILGVGQGPSLEQAHKRFVGVRSAVAGGDFRVQGCDLLGVLKWRVGARYSVVRMPGSPESGGA